MNLRRAPGDVRAPAPAGAVMPMQKARGRRRRSQRAKSTCPPDHQAHRWSRPNGLVLARDSEDTGSRAQDRGPTHRSPAAGRPRDLTFADASIWVPSDSRSGLAHSFPGATERGADRLAELTPIPEMADQARHVAQPPPKISPCSFHGRHGAYCRAARRLVGLDRMRT